MSALTPDSDPRDPYATLGVAPDTPFHEVKLVYRRLVRVLHPDVNPDDPHARERFDAVQAAFELLRAQQVSVPKPTRVPLSEGMLRTTGPFRTGSFREDPTSRADATAPLPAEEEGSEPAWRGPIITGGLTSPGSGKLLSRPTSGPKRESGPLQNGTDLLHIVPVPGRDRLLLQSRAQMFYLLLELRLSEAARFARQPVNLALVLDHSSSMQRNEKLQRLKDAVARIIDAMAPTDILSLITFGDRATVLLPSSELGDKRAAKEALDGIRSHGGTEISTGMAAGLQELTRQPPGLLSQMILLTDGQTYGDEAICLDLATQASEHQVEVTALGLGDDWNSMLLDQLAGRTGGIADYVQSAEQLAMVFDDQLRTLQHTALRHIQMTIEPTANCSVLRATWVAPAIQQIHAAAGAAPSQPCHLELGRMSSDRDYRLLVECVVTGHEPGTVDLGTVTATYEAPGLQREGESIRCPITARFVTDWVREPTVDLRVHDALRKITAYRLQEQALAAIQEGQTQRGTAHLRTAAKHLEDAGCQDLASIARAEADRAERKGQVQAGAMKRIMYGTRKLG